MSELLHKKALEALAKYFEKENVQTKRAKSEGGQ
jgi:hypothetical protein